MDNISYQTLCKWKKKYFPNNSKQRAVRAEAREEAREEAVGYFCELYSKGYALEDIPQFVGLSYDEVKRLRAKYFHFSKPFHNQEKHFKNHYLTEKKSLCQIAKDYGVSRYMVTKWRSIYFPQITTKNDLFIKLIEKRDLSINEYAMLLNTTKTNIRRFIKKV